jgi:hypothetical protein
LSGISQLTSGRTSAVELPTPSAWTRPTDWVTNDAPTGSEVFTGVVAVYDLGGNYVQFNVGTAVVNVTWGDGTTSTGVTGTISKTYTYSSVSSSVTADGYKTARLVVTLSSGTLTTLSFLVFHSSDLGANTGTSYILELKISSSTLTTLSVNNSSPPTGKLNLLLENLEITTTALTTMASFCTGMRRLQRAVITVPSTCTSTSQMFSNCHQLREVSITGTSAVTTCANMFEACYQLTSVKMRGFTHASLIMSNAFLNCISLINADLQGVSPNSGANMFQGCNRLLTVPNMVYSSLTTTSSMFSGCRSLETVPSLDLSAVTTTSNMFSGCYNLKSVGRITTSSSLTVIGAMFLSCINLTAGPTITNISGVTDSSTMYSGCTSLNYVPDMVFSAASVIATSMFSSSGLSVGPAITFPASGSHTVTSMYQSCSRLKSLPAQTWSNVSSMGTTFQFCYSLLAVPAITCNSLSSMVSTFNACYSLKDASNLTYYVTNKLQSLNATFQDCYSLVKFPDITGASMNTWINTFNGCWSLNRIVNPGQVAVGTTLSSASFSAGPDTYTSMFTNAQSVQSIENFRFTTTVSVAGLRLNAAALDSIYTNLPTRTARTITNVVKTDAATYTTSVAHGYQPGMQITTTGITPTAYNLVGQFILDCPTTTTFRLQTSATGAYVSGGTVTPAAATITVTNAVGTPTDTPTIATGKGWTVTG